MRKQYYVIATIAVVCIVIVMVATNLITNHSELVNTEKALWQPPDINILPPGEKNDLIRYGQELIVNTAVYLGPRGKVARISNGLNCQNCHLDAGTRLNGNALVGVAGAYPKYRNRSGIIESVEFRINDCMQRSLNGKTLDTLGREMQAMKAYMLWLGGNVDRATGERLSGTGELKYLPRAADTVAGKNIFKIKCVVCHGADGNGLLKPDSASYFYPPLWGSHSYNVGAGLYRLKSLASFIKYNMPFTVQPAKPQLTDEEAWDVAAYIASQQRPEKSFPEDWPDLSKKPPDHPFGPFPDTFSSYQHKFGPYEPIMAARKNKQNQ